MFINRLPMYGVSTPSPSKTLTFTEMIDTFTPSTASAWTDYDIFTNKSVPKGSVVVIKATAGARTIGLREDGSSLTRSHLMPNTAYANSTTFYVNVDSSTGNIEYYVSATSGVTFHILGYFEGATFTETWTQLTSWTDTTWVSNSVGVSNKVCELVLADSDTASTASDIGCREGGSSLSRIFNMRGTITGGYNTVSVPCNSDGSGNVELYGQTAANCTAWIQGYWQSGVSFEEDIASYTDVASGWNDYDLSADIGTNERLVMLHPGDTGGGITTGTREDGGAVGNRYLISSNTGSGWRGHSMPVNSTALGIVENYTNNTGSELFYLSGWYNVA